MTPTTTFFIGVLCGWALFSILVIAGVLMFASVRAEDEDFR